MLRPNRHRMSSAATSWPPSITLWRTRRIASRTSGIQTKCNSITKPCSFAFSKMLTYVRPLSVDSSANVSCRSINSRSSLNRSLPALNATASGQSGDKPRAISSEGRYCTSGGRSSAGCCTTRSAASSRRRHGRLGNTSLPDDPGTSPCTNDLAAKGGT